MGTYRLMLKGPRKFGLFLSTTWRDMYAHIMKNERKGNPTPCAVVIGCDPPVPLTSVARIRGDELGVAGALRGEPLEVVKCETNDLEVPAHAEIVIEGFVPPGVREHEGPFGEYTGYMGSSGPSFVIEVTAITHRADPIYRRSSARCARESSCIRGTGRDVALLQHLRRDLRLPVRDVHCSGPVAAPRFWRSRFAASIPPCPSARCGPSGPTIRRSQVGGRGRRGHRHPRLLPGPLGLPGTSARARSVREPRHGRRRARSVDRGRGRGPARRKTVLVKVGVTPPASTGSPPVGASEGGSRPRRRPLGGLRFG